MGTGTVMIPKVAHIADFFKISRMTLGRWKKTRPMVFLAMEEYYLDRIELRGKGF